ncbi:hypothetical protein FHS86_003512 [Roseimarinus sediminis]
MTLFETFIVVTAVATFAFLFLLNEQANKLSK